MKRIILCTVLAVAGFTSLHAQSLIGMIQEMDTTSIICLPEDAIRIQENATSIKILFDDPDLPDVDIPINTKLDIYCRIQGFEIEFFIHETFKSGKSVVSDYMLVQGNLVSKWYSDTQEEFMMCPGWSPMFPDQLCTVGTSKNKFIVRRYNGTMEITFKLIEYNLNSGKRI